MRHKSSTFLLGELQMSETSSSLESSGKPATTIWDSYELTRKWISEASLAVMAPTLLISLILFFHEGFNNDTPRFFPVRLLTNPEWWSTFLFGIQSTLCFALSTGRLGKARSALIISFSTGAICLLTAGIVGYAYRDIRSFEELIDLWMMLRAAVLLFLGGSIFFITYLLWRTNR